MIHRILSSLIILCSLLSLFPTSIFASSDNYFIVTAYYSPLPNQKYYLKGNYEDEKRLNGQGIAGALGKPVFSGMLAAPGKYNFGTKIHLEGLGVGVVEDRGGAIVPAGKRGYSYDRIDVWVGYGDEGLRRALYWGKRKIKGSVISTNSKTTLNYKTIPSPLWATNGLKKVSNIFHTPLGKGSDTKQVQELQKVFQEVGLYKGEIDGVYNEEIIDIVYNFQIENDIIPNEYSYGAGYWGTKTRNVFFKKYIGGDFVKSEKPEDLELLFDAPLKNSNDTKKLQEILQELTNYDGEIDGNYSSIKKHILEYQISRNIITSSHEVGAGIFGPKTRASLKEEYLTYQEQKKRQLELEKLYNEIEEEAIEKSEDIMARIGSPKYGNIDSSVRELQVYLRKIGYFDYKDTAIFGVKTRNSIIEFQKNSGVIEDNTDIGAGIFGPNTKKKFQEEVKNLLLQEKLESANVFEEMQTLNIIEEKQETEITLIERITISSI